MAANTSQWWRRLVNAYEVKGGMVCLRCKNCVIHTWALPGWVPYHGVLYGCLSFLYGVEVWMMCICYSTFLVASCVMVGGWVCVIGAPAFSDVIVLVFVMVYKSHGCCCRVLPGKGRQRRVVVHCDTSATVTHCRWLLADGLAARCQRYCNAHWCNQRWRPGTAAGTSVVVSLQPVNWLILICMTSQQWVSE